MNARFGLGLVIATVFAMGCSGAEGDATSPQSSESSSEALSVGAFSCSTLTAASFGTASDLYSPTMAGSPSTLYAFLNAAIAESTADVAHAGSHDYSLTASETLAALKDAQASLASIASWLTTENLTGTNATAAYNVAGTMNEIVSDVAQAAYTASISSIGNYPAGSGVNAASYAELYSRKIAEMANQIGYQGDYCYESVYGREVPNAGSLPDMSCTSIP
jgi:hypothetical protein